MEKRTGGIIILVKDKAQVQLLNEILSAHATIILARQGIPVPDKQISIISLVIHGSTDEIGSLTGKIGRLKDIQVKSVLLKETN
jgi:putative iron-only hydrogenase system regulator